jgi:maltose O-acetyltransferase
MNILHRLRNKLRRTFLVLKGMKIESGGQIHKGLDVVNPQNVFIGNRSILYKNITLYIGEKGRFEIGKNSHIAPYGYILADNNKLVIGDNVAIGPFCSFICHSNSYQGDDVLFRKNYLDDDIHIGNNVFIGAQCTILPGTTIKDNVVIASNSVVKGILESDSIYGGSPVKEIRKINL